MCDIFVDIRRQRKPLESHRCWASELLNHFSWFRQYSSKLKKNEIGCKSVKDFNGKLHFLCNVIPWVVQGSLIHSLLTAYRIFAYSVQVRENTDQNNFEYVRFWRIDDKSLSDQYWLTFPNKNSTLYILISQSLF